VDPCFNS